MKTVPPAKEKESSMGAKTERTPVTPRVWEDPMLNRGVGFTAAEREAIGLTGRRPTAVLTLEQQAVQDAMWQQAVQDAMWQPAYPGRVS
jgi:malate dehydrogenase (oxaloacetate-decarboxylating)